MPRASSFPLIRSQNEKFRAISNQIGFEPYSNLFSCFFFGCASKYMPLNESNECLNFRLDIIYRYQYGCHWSAHTKWWISFVMLFFILNTFFFFFCLNRFLAVIGYAFSLSLYLYLSLSHSICSDQKHKIVCAFVEVLFDARIRNQWKKKPPD